MPDKVVEVPGVGNVAFPDSMTDDQIAAQISKGFSGQDTLQEPQGSASSRFFGSLWDQLNPANIARGLYQIAKASDDPKQIQAVTNAVIKLHSDQLDKMKDAWGRGDYTQALGHALGTFPMIGPAAAAVGEQMGGTDPVYDKYGSIITPGKTPDIAGGLGSAVGLLAPSFIGEVSAAAKPIVKPIIKPIIQKIMPDAEKLYRTALKPPVTMEPSDIAEVVQTGLKSGVPISEGGVRKLDGLIDDLQKSIDARVQAADQLGIKIDPQAVAARVDPVQQRLGSRYSQVNPEQASRDIQSVKEEFLGQHTIPGQPAGAPQPTGLYDASGNPIMTPGTPATAPQSIPIPAGKAQEMKKGTYAQIRDQYDKLSSATVEGQKALARGLKEELTAAIPELGIENAQEGKLLDLQPLLEKAVNRAANRSNGFRDLVTAGVGTVATGQPKVGFGLAAMRRIMEDPAVRSQLAIVINKAQQMNPGKYGAPSMKTALLRLDAYSAALNQAIDQAQQNQGVNP